MRCGASSYGQTSITVDDNSKKVPSNTKMHRNDNEVALHMTLTQHLKGMDSLNSALGNLKQEESEYLAQMTDHVQDGHTDAFDDALTEQAILEALKQDSLELAQSEVPPSTEPVKQTEKKKVSFIDNQDVATPKEPAKSASTAQAESSEVYDPYKDPINGPAILAAMAGKDMPVDSQQEIQDTPKAPIKETTEKAAETSQAKLPLPQWGSVPQWGFSQANKTDEAPSKPAEKEMESKSQLEQSSQDQKGGYVLGTGKKVGTDKTTLNEATAQPIASVSQPAAPNGKVTIPPAQPKKTQKSKFMSFSDIKGKDDSDAPSSKSVKKKGSMDDLQGLEGIHKTLLSNGYKLHFVSGEGCHCGSRSLMIGLIAHFKHLEEDAGNEYLSNLKGVMKNPHDRVALDGMFRAAKRSMDNILQTGNSRGLEIARLRLPTEKPSFHFGATDFATDGEKLIKRFLTSLANSNELDNKSSRDLLRSINSPTKYMDSDTITRALQALRAYSSIVTQDNGQCWHMGDEAVIDSDILSLVPHQYNSVIARMEHAHFVAYAK